MVKNGVMENLLVIKSIRSNKIQVKKPEEIHKVSWVIKLMKSKRNQMNKLTIIIKTMENQRVS